jgi:hypothetical protein
MIAAERPTSMNDVEAIRLVANWLTRTAWSADITIAVNVRVDARELKLPPITKFTFALFPFLRAYTPYVCFPMVLGLFKRPMFTAIRLPVNEEVAHISPELPSCNLVVIFL